MRKNEYNNSAKAVSAATYAKIIKIIRYFLYIYILIIRTK